MLGVSLFLSARKPVSPNKNLSKSLDSEVFENDKIDATVCDKSREKSPEKTNCDNDEEEPREMNKELEKNYRVMLDIKVKKIYKYKFLVGKRIYSKGHIDPLFGVQALAKRILAPLHIFQFTH